MTAPLLLDNSAWARLADASLPADRLAEVADAVEHGTLVVSLPFLLEAGYSARNGREHADLLQELLALPIVSIDEHVERRAIDAQRQLAAAGHHRLPPVDLIIAALADHHDLGVLHYDHDYDVVAHKTDLSFHSVWLVPRGSL